MQYDFCMINYDSIYIDGYMYKMYDSIHILTRCFLLKIPPAAPGLVNFHDGATVNVCVDETQYSELHFVHSVN